MPIYMELKKSAFFALSALIEISVRLHQCNMKGDKQSMKVITREKRERNRILPVSKASLSIAKSYDDEYLIISFDCIIGRYKQLEKAKEVKEQLEQAISNGDEFFIMPLDE